MKSNSINKNLLKGLPLLLSVIILLVGCASKPQGFSVTGGDMINNAKANEQANLDMVRTKQTEAFDKHFSNGLYWEQYDELEKALNKEFNKIYEKELGRSKNYHYSCLTKNEYYKDSLKKLKNGQLTVNQILANPKDHIWKMKFLILAGESQAYKNSEHNPSDVPLQCRFSDFNDKYRATGLHDMENWLVTCNNLMQSKNEAIMMSLKEDPASYVLNNANLATLYVGNLEGTGFTDTNVSSVKRQLKNKYKEDFIWVGAGINENRLNGNLYAPIRDTSLQFMVGYMDNEDKYLTVLAQRAMYEEVEKIIEDEGYGGKIAHLTTPDARTEDTLNNYLRLDTELADMSVKRSNKEIIDKVFKGTYDTSLNLMLDQNEEIDYKKLKRICARIAGLSPTAYEQSKNWGTRNKSLIYFYRLDEVKRKVVLDMFSKEWCTENYFREPSTLTNMWDNMERERAETTGFHYLDVYGEKQNEYMVILRSQEELEDMAMEEFTSEIVLYNRGGLLDGK